MSARPDPSPVLHVSQPAPTTAQELPARALRLLIGAIICTIGSVALGYGAWYFLDGPAAPLPVMEDSRAGQVVSPPPQAPAPTPVTVKAPAGELPVTGGEVVLGGGVGLPLRRFAAEPFAVAETEVTNEQYSAFVKETGRKAPASWAGGEYPPGAAVEPVTAVTWDDAVAFCEWLSQKVGARVSLPTEAEWVLAARGTDGRKYPWGNEWNARAAASREGGGRVRAVRSFPENRSPFGAYDMAGNVWEWTADEARDGAGNALTQGGVPLRVAKGGAADEPAALISVDSRKEVPQNLTHRSLGFRYIVRR